MPRPGVFALFCVAASNAACRRAADSPEVRVAPGQAKVQADSSGGYGYRITTTQPVSISGRDSAGLYLLVVWYRQGVRLRAEERPDSGETAVVVNGGRGKLSVRSFGSRCTELTKTDCLTRYSDPEVSFTVLGYVPATRIAAAR